MAIAADIGTSNLVSARSKNGKIEFRIQRDAFLDLELDESTKAILDSLKVGYIIKGKKILVTGDSALSLANSFRQEVRRPMYKGVISNRDELGKDVLHELIKATAGKAESENETCFYTIPAQPLGLSTEDFDVTYHSQIIQDSLRELGYSPHPINEALCIAYSELADTRFTGVCVSMGGGNVNACLANLGVINQGASFALQTSGDWLDKMVAGRKAGMTISKVTKIKEDQTNPIHLIKDDGSPDLIRDAICKFYRSLIRNVIQNIFSQFHDMGSDFDKPLPIIVAGGTSLIAGFMDVFNNELQKADKPFPIGEVRHAKDALYTVCHGALVRASLG